MGYIAVLAEKESVATEIAKVLGVTERKSSGGCGYIEGNGYRITWAMGHLVRLLTPEEMGFRSGEVPMFPTRWDTTVISGTGGNNARQRQLKIIDSCFKECSEIVVATDAGREGELIFRYIYEHLGCRKPFRRLWISSLTEDAIRKGFRELRDGHDYDALSDAAHLRSIADWLIGLNASRALRLSSTFDGVLSLGRVQTPTLGMVCERYRENTNFQPSPFWRICLNGSKDGVHFHLLSEDRFLTPEDADRAYWRARSHPSAIVASYKKETRHIAPPLLYDITALQRDANNRYGLTANESLSAAQSLYEKKLLSYPRTGSRYISEDVFRTIPDLISGFVDEPVLGTLAREMARGELSRRSVDDKKITDHHALLPLGGYVRELEGNEALVYNLVYARLLEAFGEAGTDDVSSVVTMCGEDVYIAKASRPSRIGWRTVRARLKKAGERSCEENEENEVQTEDFAMDEGILIPEMDAGYSIRWDSIEKKAGMTKPLPILTDASLLGLMETCGKNVDDDDVREAMKDCGLGTQATRTGIIEKLIKYKYIERKGRKLLPTDTGQRIWDLVKGKKIADVKNTGLWERDLRLVEKGQILPGTFKAGIRTLAEEVVKDLAGSGGIQQESNPYVCPFCGEAMKDLRYNIVCDCGFSIPKELLGKRLSDGILRTLSHGESTPTLNGFISKKTGRKFQAKLTVNPYNKKVEFAFD